MVRLLSSLMANDTFLRDWILDGERDASKIDRYLREVREKYGALTSFLVSERSRKHYTSHGILPSVREDEFRDRWFFRVRKMKAPYETNVDPDLATRDTMTIFINYRILDYHGNFIGVTGVGLELDTVKKIIDSYRDRFRREVYFVDSQGMIVLAGKSMNQANTSIRTQPGIGEIADAILRRSDKPAQLEYRLNGAIGMVNSRFIPELGWYLVVEERGNENIAAVTQVLEINLAIGAGVTLLILVLAFGVVNGYQKRLKEEAKQAVSNAEAEARLAQEQQQFVAMVSHEFRTPLSIIDASLQNLTHFAGAVPEQVLSRLAKIQRASQRMQDLISNYLTKDRLGQAGINPRAETVDIRELIVGMALLTEWPNMTIHADALSANISGDETLLKVAFSNLMDNAVKYSPPDGNIRVDGEMKDGYVEIRVFNAGPGIAPENLPRLFDKYFRLEGNTSGGVGLGLYLVRRIIELHGGSVSVESVVGQGVTAIVRLPLEN